MNIKPLQIYSQQKNIYEISKGLSITVNLHRNPYNIPMDTLFSMASRKNPKRRFLFVSKILGKHIPVNPHVPLLGGAILALHYFKTVYNTEFECSDKIVSSLVNKSNYTEVYSKIRSNLIKLPDNVLFIGFAETATALGHAFFNCFSQNGTYIHTTREKIIELVTLVKFEEEHSHATSHRIYSLQKGLLDSKDQIVLIDDELTTGKTALNIIEAIQTAYPRKKYVLASLLDWRSEDDIKKFRETESRLGIEIVTVSLISGTIDISDDTIDGKVTNETSSDNINILRKCLNPEINFISLSHFFNDKLKLSSINSPGEINLSPYLKETGRFGINSEENKDSNELIKEVGTFLRNMRKGEKALCLGTGEFMFLPANIASYMGTGISYHSTTRSPIYAIDKEDYAVRNSFSFESPDDPSVINYLYNIPLNYYDDLYIFFERTVSEKQLAPLLEVLKGLGIPRINMVTCFKESK